MRAQQAAIRQRKMRVRRFDDQDFNQVRRATIHEPHRTTRQIDVVARLNLYVAPVGVEVAKSLVNEQQRVAIRVSRDAFLIVRHAPVAQLARLAVQDHWRLPRRGRATAATAMRAREIKRARPQRPLKTGPTRRRLRMIEEGCPARRSLPSTSPAHTRPPADPHAPVSNAYLQPPEPGSICLWSYRLRLRGHCCFASGCCSGAAS